MVVRSDLRCWAQQGSHGRGARTHSLILIPHPAANHIEAVLMTQQIWNAAVAPPCRSRIRQSDICSLPSIPRSLLRPSHSQPQSLLYINIDAPPVFPIPHPYILHSHQRNHSKLTCLPKSPSASHKSYRPQVYAVNSFSRLSLQFLKFSEHVLPRPKVQRRMASRSE